MLEYGILHTEVYEYTDVKNNECLATWNGKKWGEGKLDLSELLNKLAKEGWTIDFIHRFGEGSLSDFRYIFKRETK